MRTYLGGGGGEHRGLQTPACYLMLLLFMRLYLSPVPVACAGCSMVPAGMGASHSVLRQGCFILVSCTENCCVLRMAWYKALQRRSGPTCYLQLPWQGSGFERHMGHSCVILQHPRLP
jgi:hypothetical protein